MKEFFPQRTFHQLSLGESWKSFHQRKSLWQILNNSLSPDLYIPNFSWFSFGKIYSSILQSYFTNLILVVTDCFGNLLSCFGFHCLISKNLEFPLPFGLLWHPIGLNVCVSISGLYCVLHVGIESENLEVDLFICDLCWIEVVFFCS